MIYPFKCPKCGKYDEIACHVSEYTDLIPCGDCGEFMDRIFTPIAVKVPNLEGYNAALGCANRDTKRKIKELNSNGMDIQEMGNDRIEHKPKAKSYDLSRDDIHKINQSILRDA